MIRVIVVSVVIPVDVRPPVSVVMVVPVVVPLGLGSPRRDDFLVVVVFRVGLAVKTHLDQVDASSEVLV